MKFVQSKNEKEKMKNWEEYKIDRKKTKLAIMPANNVALKNIYIVLEGKGGDNNLYMLYKVR